jgi:hypothetical protein
MSSFSVFWIFSRYRARYRAKSTWIFSRCARGEKLDIFALTPRCFRAAARGSFCAVGIFTPRSHFDRVQVFL